MNSHVIPPAIHSQLLAFNHAEPFQRIRSGLSAASLWKCQTPRGNACLRGWPPGQPQPERLERIHDAMRQLSADGLSFTPRLYCTSQGQSIACDGNRLWELTSWLPGKADYLRQPSDAKLDAAMHALATIHEIWGRTSQTCHSPTVQDRLAILDRWLKDLAPKQAAAMRGASNAFEAELVASTWQALQREGPLLSKRLNGLLVDPVTTHFVLRDIWSEHVLFIDQQVSGVIDFGAARIDEPTTDLVRLLSSLEPTDPTRREYALAVYERCRGMPIDRRRFDILDRTATLLSAAQWMQWLVVEQRNFHLSRSELLQRWQHFLARHAQLCSAEGH